MKIESGLKLVVAAVRELRFAGTLASIDITVWGANWGQGRRTDEQVGTGWMPGFKLRLLRGIIRNARLYWRGIVHHRCFIAEQT